MSGPSRTTPRKMIDAGALVYIFTRSNGTYGVVSTDRSIEGWGDSLDKAWRMYFVRARRAMRKSKTPVPAVVDTPTGPGELDPNAEDFMPDDGNDFEPA